MSLYDTASIEALLAQQEEEWTDKVRKRREKHSSGAALDEDAMSENHLQLSAHSSADRSSSGLGSGDEGYDPYQIGGGGKNGGQKGTGNHKKKHSAKKPDGLSNKKRNTAAADGDDDDINDSSAVPYAASRFEVSLPQLAQTARLLKKRFKAFCDAHPNTKGVSRLDRRFDKELSLAEEALARVEPKSSEQHSNGQPANDDEGAQKKEDGRQPYSRCNGLLLLEILLACVENEQDVTVVLHGEPMRNNGGPVWSRQFVDVDVVSQGGSRWTRVKGTSLRNLEADFQGNSERKPFVATANNFSKAAAAHMLPFGRHPSTVIMLSELPADDEPDPKLAQLRDRVRSELQGDAGITFVESYLSPSLTGEVEAQADMYAIDDADKAAWAISAAPEAVEERLLAHKRLWPARGKHLPYHPPEDAVPKLINFDVTALVAICSDTCHAFDMSMLFTLEEFAVLRRQVEDEKARHTLEEHVYPCLDKYTVAGAPRWWRHWHHDDALPLDGAICGVCGPVETTSASAPPLGGQPLPFPFTHDDLVAYIDELGVKPVEGPEGLNIDGTQKKISDIIWTPEQHEAEREIDKKFPFRSNWIMSEVAMTEFNWILRTISGPKEMPRADRLLKFFHVIPTDKFVHVAADPIFVVEAETASQRKERRRNEEKMQRRKYADQPDESKVYQAQHVPKGLNRQSLIALDAAVKAGVPDTNPTSPTTGDTPTDGCSSDFPVGAVSRARSGLQSATPPPDDCSESNPVSPTSATGPLSAAAAASPASPFTLFEYLPSHAQNLECTGKIKARHKAVFGLGDALRGITLTANEQFVQASGEQFVTLQVQLHCSRALIGKKVTIGLSKRASANASVSAVPEDESVSTRVSRDLHEVNYKRYMKSAQSRRPPSSTPSVGRVSAPASTNITSLPWRTLSQLAAAEGTTKHQERVRQYRASQKEKEEGGEVVLNSASSPVLGGALPNNSRQHVNCPDQTKHSRLASMRGSNDQLVQRREAEVARRRLRSAHQRRLIDLAFNDMSDKVVADKLRISSRQGARSKKGFEAMFDSSLFDDEDEADEFFMQIAAVSASVKKPPLNGRMNTNPGGPRRSSSSSGRCDSVIPSRPSTAKGWDPQLLQKNQDASRPTTADSGDLREGSGEADTDMDDYSDTDDLDDIPPVARDEQLHALYYGSVAGPTGEGSGGGERSLPTSAMEAVPSSSPIRPPTGRHKSQKSQIVTTNLQSRPATAAKPKPKSAHNSRPATATTAIFDKSSPSVCVALASFRPNWARAITDLEAKGRHRIVAAEVTAFSTVMYHYALEMDGMLALATTVARWSRSILEAEYAHRDKLVEDQRDIRTQLVKEERSTRRRLARFIEKKKARKGDASEASVENRREEAVSGLEALLLKTSLQRNNMSTRSGSSSAASNSLSRPSTAEGGGANLLRFRPTSSTSATRSNQLSRRPSTVSTLHPGRIGREEGARPSTSNSAKMRSSATSRPATAQSAESNFTAKAIREKNRPKTNAVTEKDIRQRDERWLREAGRFTDGLKRELLQQKGDEPSRPPTQGAGVFGARALAASQDGPQNEGHMEAGSPKHSHSKTKQGGLTGAKLLAETRYEQKLADALTEEEWEKKRWLARHSHIAPITRHRQMQSMGRNDLKKGLPIASTQNVKNTDYFMLEASPDHSLANPESEMQATTLQPNGLGARFDRSMFLPFSGASEFEHQRQQLRANSRGGNSESLYSKSLGNSVPLVSMMGASTSLNNTAGGESAAIRRQPSRRKRMSAVTASKYSDRLRRAEALGPSGGAESGEALKDSKQPQAQPAAMSAKALAIERSVGFISSYRAPSAAVAMSGSVNAESSASAANFDDKAVTRRRSVAHAGTITVHSVAGSTLDLNGASPLRFNTNNTMIFNATGGTTSPSSAAIADSHRASVSSLTRVVDRSNRISVVTVDSSAGESSVNPAEGGALMFVGDASPNSGSISNATNNTSGGSRQGRVTVMADEPHQADGSGGAKSANNSISVPRRKSRIEIIEDPDMSAKDADMAGQHKAIGPPSLLGTKDHPTSFYYKVNVAPKAVKLTGGVSARAAASERSEMANQVKYFSAEPDNNEVDEAGEAASSSHINSNTNNNKASLRVSAEEWALDASDFM